MSRGYVPLVKENFIFHIKRSLLLKWDHNSLTNPFFCFQGSLSGSHSSSRASTPTHQVTKVTATAKFKVEVHAPSASSSIDLGQHYRPSPGSGSSARRSSRRSSKSGGASGQPQDSPKSVHSSLTESLRSSLNNSVSSSLNSNEGDLGFSEK